MLFRTIGIDDTEVTLAEDVGIGNDEGTIDTFGNIVDVEFGKALDNTAVGGFDCIGDEWFVFLYPLLNYFSWFYEEDGKGGLENEMFVTW